jgi:molecular chaperone GrpE
MPIPKKENNKDDLINISKKDLEELKEKAKLNQDYYDQLLRLKAEFENFKKRTDKEKTEFLNFANQALIYELLDIIDNFERAVAAADKTNDHKLLHQGVEMILKDLHNLLKEKGLSKIESLGKPFDPAKHEAVSQVETEEQPDHTIVEELQTGYMINGRVVRPAKVKVSVKPQERAEEEDKKTE